MIKALNYSLVTFQIQLKLDKLAKFLIFNILILIKFLNF